MTAAVEAMAAGAFDLAEPVLDTLAADYPDWAEVWNKRATVYYASRRDSEALSDIRRALTIEPRHFGAIIGFGQICMRQRRYSEAKAAFEIAQRIHPYIDGLASIIDDLSGSIQRKH